MYDMNPNVFIKDTMKFNKEKIKELLKNYKKKDLASLVALLLSIGVSVCAIPFSLSVCLASATVAAQLTIYKYKIDKKHNASEKSINQENIHLKKLYDKGIEVSDELNDKRKNKIISLGEAYRDNAKKYLGVEAVNSVMNGFTTGVAVLTIINPLCAWSSLALLIVDGMLTKIEINAHETGEKLENRINNLDNDLTLIDIIIDEYGNPRYEIIEEKKKEEKAKTKSNIKVTKEDIEKENNYFENCLKEINNNKVLKKVK